MRRDCLAAAIMVLIGFSATQSAASCALPPEAQALQAQVGQMLNAERQRHGLPPLRHSPRLAQAAQRQACDMAVNGVRSHTGSDGSSPRARIRAVGECTRLAAENIAWGQRSPGSAVSWWMNSPGHRSNILLNRVTSYGVAVAQPAPGVGGGPRWVMVVARSC